MVRLSWTVFLLTSLCSQIVAGTPCYLDMWPHWNIQHGFVICMSDACCFLTWPFLPHGISSFQVSHRGFSSFRKVVRILIFGLTCEIMTMSTCSLEIKQYTFHKPHWAEAQLPLGVGRGSPGQVLGKSNSVSFATYERGSLWKDICCPSLHSCSHGICLHWSLPMCKEQVMWLAPHPRGYNTRLLGLS